MKQGKKNLKEKRKAKNKMADVSTRTSLKEKIKRFEFINSIFMEKYLDLVWFARSNPDKLIEDEQYETVQSVLKSIQAIADKYPKEAAELCEDETSWQHGFNSGILAYSRFLSSYIEDGLWELCEENKDIAEHEKIIEINGKKYIEFDGRQDAFDSFPELDT